MCCVFSPHDLIGRVDGVDFVGLYEASKANSGGGTRSAYGAWVEYVERKSGKPFYYNTVTRKCVRNKPKDFRPNKGRLVKEVIFGLSFYH